MATEPRKPLGQPGAGTGGAGGSPVETRVGREPVRGIELGMENNADGSRPRVQSHDARGVTVELDRGEVQTHLSDQAPSQRQRPQAGEDGGLQRDPDDLGDEEEGGVEGEGGQEGGDQGGGEALPEFDPAKPETVTAYDAAYMKDGSPNLENLSATWWKGAKRTEDGSWDGSLPESTYKYLETKGYPKAMVKQIEAGQVAAQVIKEANVYARAGGADRMTAALEWARKGGYTPAQRDRYMKAINSSDTDAVNEQVDLLVNRWGTATGNGKRPGTPNFQAKPARTVANAGGGPGGSGGVQPYANYGEYQGDLRKARAEGNQTLYNEARARLRASPWSGLQGKK